MKRTTWIQIMAAALLLLGALFVGPAFSQPLAVDQLKLTLARQCVNEAGFRHRADCEAIWQTTQGIAGGRTATVQELLEAQFRLSPAIADSDRWLAEARSPRAREIRAGRLTHGNMRWSLNLHWNREEPVGWPRPGPGWEGFHQNRWDEIQAWAERRILGHLERRAPALQICTGMPITWGGRWGLDDHIMAARNRRRVERGLEPWHLLICQNQDGDRTLNGFWGRPPRARSMSAAGGNDG